MKARKLLSLVISLVMVIGMIPFYAVSVSADASTVYYVSAAGDDEANSGAADSPFATVNHAIAAIGSGDGTVVVMDKVTDWPTASFAGKIEVTGKDPATGDVYADAGICRPAGSRPTVSSDLTMSYIKDYIGSSKYNPICYHDCDLVLGAGFRSITNDGGSTAPQIMNCAGGGNVSFTTSSPTFDSGIINWGNVKISGDYSVSYLAGSAGGFYLGGDTGSSAVTAEVTGHTFLLAEDTDSVSFVRGGMKEFAVGKFNGIQALFVNAEGSGISDYAYPDGAVGSFTNNGPEYIVRASGSGASGNVKHNGFGSISVTVPAGYQVTVGDDTYTESFDLSLSAGETTLTFKRIPLYYVASAGDDSVNDGTKDSPFASVNHAIAAIGDDDGVIVVMDKVSDWPSASFAGKIEVTGKDPATGDVYANAGITRPNARPTVSTKLALSYLKDYIPAADAWNQINCASSDLVIGEGVRVVPQDGHTYTMQIYFSGASGSPVFSTHSPMLGSGITNWGDVYLSGDLTVNYLKGSSGTFNLAGDANPSSGNTASVAGHTFLLAEDTDGVSFVRGGDKAASIGVFNGIQALFVNAEGSTITSYPYPDGAIGSFTNNGPEYIVRATGKVASGNVKHNGFGSISVTVPEGYKVTVGDDTYTENFTLSLSTGETSLVFARASAYYVASSGDDNGAGTKSSPFATVNHAIESIGDDDGVIVVMDKVTDWPTAAFAGKIEVTGKDPATGDVYADAGICRPAGCRPIVASDLTMSYIKDYIGGGEYNPIGFHDCDLVLGAGYRSINSSGVAFGPQIMNCANGGNVSFTTSSATYKSGINNWSNVKISGDYYVNYLKGSSGSFNLGGDTGDYVSSAEVTGRTFLLAEDTDGVTFIRGGMKNYSAGKFNGIQALFVNAEGSGITSYSYPAGAAGSFTNNGPEYIVRANGEAASGNVKHNGFGSISVTVPENYKVLVGENTYYEDFDLTLSDGETTLTFLADIGITETDYDEVTDLNRSTSFYVEGVQVRLFDQGSGSADQGLRFVATIGKDILDRFTALNADNKKPTSSSDTGIGYGFLVTPAAKVTGELTFDTAKKTVVPAVNTYKEISESANNDSLQFTVCILGIDAAHWTNDITARPYITYKDSYGNVYTAYGEEYTTSVYDAVDFGIKNDPTNADALSALMDAYKAEITVK